ncbi:Crp/Fnr family transcriptional regulator [Jannaschia pohangensis]|uniref:CRP/FNR family transcriptional regulator, anaerobic regulatory protein n=1 Tax=Jannaschia pohangensis TaxID=390807 RepID=A0A1I3GZY7_9RHOB|nr:helix-turn-helix domain-containing protein [Jannaschia pohangensis]SFI28936.1 CRP/FNR family transcriptional regulator, anaerobic regulatory protein [Jannaschia pohangensis]
MSAYQKFNQEPAVHIRRPRLHPVRTLDAGDVLFHETDPATCLFEVKSGVLRLTRLLENGRRHVIGFAHAGDIVGFSSDHGHTADCTALSETTVLVHRRGEGDSRDANAEQGCDIEAAAMRQIETLQDHLLLMARPGACGKLASFLLAQVDHQAGTRADLSVLQLEMPRSDIADYLCMTPETVSRALTKMRRGGLIRLETAQRIAILDREGLAEMAGAE